MKGDFSRITFDPKKHYSRVLMQQGRVQLDADWNEQTAIILHRLETMARDLIGPFGGPAAECGFEIKVNDAVSGDFVISKGRYYVDGILCQNDDETFKYNFKVLGLPDGVVFRASPDSDYLVFLDAWEQYINAFEDPNIREPALGGPDTSGRSKVVWSFRIVPYLKATTPKDAIAGALKILQPSQGKNGNLLVETKPGDHDDSPCILSPDAQFRGLENQLYRVEIHTSGIASAIPLTQPSATFKWSRENGSDIFPILSAKGQKIVLKPGYSTLGLKSGDWVELIDDDRAAKVQPDHLLEVKSVERLEVTMKAALVETYPPLDKHPYLRRWDQKNGPANKNGLTLSEDGAAFVVEDHPFALEDGIQITFMSLDNSQHEYRSGDFWYITARTAEEGRKSLPTPPDGLIHHYAPLAVLTFDGKFSVKEDRRIKFSALGTV